MADKRIIDITTQARAHAADDVSELDGTANASRKISPFDAHGQFRNALAPRGGVVFDGNAGRISRALTNQSILTDDFSVSMFLSIPATNPTNFQSLWGLSSSATSNAQPYAIEAYISNSGGNLVVILQGAVANTDYRSATITGFVAAYAGKVVMLTVVRSGASLLIYANGSSLTYTTATAGTAPTWQGSITSTYFGFGGHSGNYFYAGNLLSFTLYNLALSVDNLLEIYELGGAVPERYKFGFQNLLASPTNDGTFDGVSTTWSADGLATVTLDTSGDKLDVVLTGANGGCRIGNSPSTQFVRPLVVAPSKLYRIKFTLSAVTGGLIRVYDNANGVVLADNLTSGSHDMTVNTGGASAPLFRIYVTAVSGSFSLDNFSLSQVGAVAHYDADLDGIGYQLHDQSSNKLHALLTTTGVAWTKAATVGYVKALSDGTTSAQALGGGTILPATSQITRIRARSISGTPSITLGTSSGGSQIVASVALSTTWKDLTIALTGGINTAAASLWMTASAANVVEVQVAYEQLPA